MTKQTRILVCIVTLLVTLVATVRSADNQLSAASLAERLEKKLLSSPGVSMQFELPGEGRVTLIADIKSRRVRIESPSVLVISDGEKIWNYQKASERVTIDAVSASSPFRDPAGIFQFSKNYAVRIVSHAGEHYQLELKPDEHLQSLLKAAGGIASILLDVTVHGKEIKIEKATTSGAKGEIQTGALSIKSLKTVKPSDFVLKMTNKMKVLDLRE